MSNSILKNAMKIALVSSAVLVASAQAATDTANATATVVTTLTITKTADLVYGNLAPGASGGTLVMSPAGVRSTTGTVVTYSSTFNAASFNVVGTTDATYSITLPSTDVTLTSGGNTMTVNTFASNPSGTGTLTGGSETLNVGATLNVSSGQAAGSYSGTFDVTVDYN